MADIYPIDDPISLESLASRITKSSNFRFSWQFYHCESVDANSPEGIRRVLNTVIETPDHHDFLRRTFDETYDDVFEIGPLHEHATISPAADEFENVLARAVNDHLGAYSRDLRDGRAREKKEVQKTFAELGAYNAFAVLPGNATGCEVCEDHTNHLFTNWFFGVAWDWCFLLAWPQRKLLWIGCMTDTD